MELVKAPIASDYPSETRSIDDLGDQIVAAAGRLAAATCQWLLLIAEFDAREGCKEFGLASTAQWLSWACGLSHRTAVEHVRVAHGLAVHPQLVREMSSGRISYSHVRAITRVVDPGDVELVDSLVMTARHGTVRHLETLVRGLRTVDELTAEKEPSEYATCGWAPNGRWRLSARLDPESGAVIATAMTAVARAEDLSPAAALARMAEIALAAINDRAKPPRLLRGEERAAVVIHVEAKDLPHDAEPDTEAVTEADAGNESDTGDVTEDDAGNESETDSVVKTVTETDARSESETGDVVETDAGNESNTGASPRANPGVGRRSRERGAAVGRIAGGPGLPRAVIERLLCSGRIRTAVYERDSSGRSNVLDLGRSNRVVTERQFKALLLRDGGCSHPGCHGQLGLEAHHVRHWIHGGRTNLDNLVLLCRRHHHAHHAREFTIVPAGQGRFSFRARDGKRLPERINASEVIGTFLPVDEAQAHLATDAARSRWDGQRLDRHYAVHVLAATRDRTRSNSRGGSALLER